MGYRDDRDAMLARLDALEREVLEVGALRARVAELEEENRRLVARVAELQGRLRPLVPPRPDPANPDALIFRIRDLDGDRELALDREIIKIGTGPQCDLRIADPDASRIHAVIERTPEQVQLIDLGSKLRTRVNGEAVSRAELRDGDLIVIGAATIAVGISPAAGGTP